MPTKSEVDQVVGWAFSGASRLTPSAQLAGANGDQALGANRLFWSKASPAKAGKGDLPPPLAGTSPLATPKTTENLMRTYSDPHTDLFLSAY